MENGIDEFSVTGKIKAGLPPFAFPNFTLVNGTETITTGQIFGVGWKMFPGPFFVTPFLLRTRQFSHLYLCPFLCSILVRA